MIRPCYLYHIQEPSSELNNPSSEFVTGIDDLQDEVWDGFLNTHNDDDNNIQNKKNIKTKVKKTRTEKLKTRMNLTKPIKRKALKKKNNWKIHGKSIDLYRQAEDNQRKYAQNIREEGNLLVCILCNKFKTKIFFKFMAKAHSSRCGEKIR